MSKLMPPLPRPTLLSLGRLAIAVAITAPERRNPHSPSCYVAWDTVEEIRKELEAAKYPWRETAREFRRILKDRTGRPAK